MRMTEKINRAQPPIGGEEQVWTELSDALLMHVVSLCTQPYGKRPTHVGTGVLVEVNGQPFLVSARHVLVEVKSLFFYVDTNVVRKLKGKLLLGRVSPGSLDRIDLAVMRLEGPGLPPYPGVEKVCLDGNSMFRPAALPRRGKHYLVTGFPASRSKANPHAMQLKSEAWCLIAGSAEPPNYERLGLAEETHLVLTLDRRDTLRTDGAQHTFPDPHGMSGSPVWWLPDETNGIELPMLVGIVIEYHASLSALVAIDVREVVQQIGLLMREQDPEA